jgi:ATP-binding cassette subfamily E protein 1
MNKWVEVDYDRCDPKKCDPEKGKCPASLTCKHDILDQEEPFEAPMQLSRDQCVGCEDCIKSCPLKAIKESSGV